MHHHGSQNLRLLAIYLEDLASLETIVGAPVDTRQLAVQVGL